MAAGSITVNSGLAPNNVPITIKNNAGTVVGAGTNGTAGPPFTIEHTAGAAGIVGGSIMIGPKPPHTSFETISKLGIGKQTYTSDQEAAKMRGAGGGRTDDQAMVLTGQPGSFVFSPMIFDPNNISGAMPFLFDRSIQLPDTSPINLGEPVNFGGQIDLTPTSDPSLFDARFSAFDFQYPIFDLPELGLAGVTRQVLDASAEVSGFLNLEDGNLRVPLSTNWLNSNGIVVTTSYELFQIGVHQFSSNLFDVSLVSDGTFGFIAEPVPEPSTYFLFGTGLLILLGYGCRQKHNAA